MECCRETVLKTKESAEVLWGVTRENSLRLLWKASLAGFCARAFSADLDTARAPFLVERPGESTPGDVSFEVNLTHLMLSWNVRRCTVTNCLGSGSAKRRT